jgi:hypothetical protein
MMRSGSLVAGRNLPMRTAPVLALAAVALAACYFPPPAAAQGLPFVNLGSTSFMDGGPPAGPGLYYNQYLQFYRAHRINNAEGDPIPLSGPRLNVWASLTQFIFLSKHELFGIASPALDILIPVAEADLDFGAPGPVPRSNDGGLGDVLIGPALQFKPITDGSGKPVFVTRLEAQFIIPTGKYSPEFEVNPGSNFFSFDPYWSGTLFLGPKLASSFRAHYLWNAENHEPPRSLRARETHAGQAFHVNFTLDYEVMPKQLRVGMNGYGLKQTTASTIDGVSVPGREEVLAFGPGLLYSWSEKTHLFVNLYFETSAENRPEGTNFVLRFVHKF